MATDVEPAVDRLGDSLEWIPATVVLRHRGKTARPFVKTLGNQTASYAGFAVTDRTMIKIKLRSGRRILRRCARRPENTPA